MDNAPTITISRPDQIDVVNPLKLANFNAEVLKFPDATIFHSIEWLKVLVDSYGYQPHYLMSKNENNINAIIPLMEVNSRLTGKRGICLPFSDYCEPLLSDSADAVNIWEKLNWLGKTGAWQFIETRGKSALNTNHLPNETFYRHRISLTENEKVVFNNLRGNYRSKIRKSIKEGVEVRHLTTMAAMEDYYRLHCLTRKRHGLPPQPLYFFKNIHKHIISQNLGFVSLAFYNNQTVAGAVYFHFGDTLVYKFGASDAQFQKHNPNFLLMWDAIQWGCNNGYKTFCFGKTSVENEGLVQFKDGWGAEKTVLNYYRLKLNPQSPGYNLLKKMPISLLKMAGQILYKHIA